MRAAGYAFETMAVDVDERTRDGEAYADYVRRLAEEKSAAAAVRLKTDAAFAASGADAVILAADTAVVIDGEILGKPRDDEDAERMLRLLSGRDHQVLTGISLRRDARELGGVISTVVRFNALSDDDVAWYVRSGAGRDKAGGYAVQGLAAVFIERIAGSYSGIMGLPLFETAALLRTIGWSPSTHSGSAHSGSGLGRGRA